MIIYTLDDDILKTEASHLAFIVSLNKNNENEFAKMIVQKYWNELNNYSNREVGEVLSKQVCDKILHAMVCYPLSLERDNNQAEIIQNCLNSINTYGDIISVPDLEDNLINYNQFILGLMDSKAPLMLHTNRSFDEIKEIYHEEKKRRIKTLNRG